MTRIENEMKKVVDERKLEKEKQRKEKIWGRRNVNGRCSLDGSRPNKSDDETSKRTGKMGYSVKRPTISQGKNKRKKRKKRTGQIESDTEMIEKPLLTGQSRFRKKTGVEV